MLVAALGMGMAAVAAEPPARHPVSISAADNAYAALRALMHAQPPQGLDQAATDEWAERRNRRIMDAAEAFIDAYPLDPRRWTAANLLASHVFGAETQTRMRADKVRGLLTGALLATDISAADWALAKGHQVGELLEAARAAGAAADLSAVRAALDELTRRAPDSRQSRMFELAHVELLAERDPKLARARLERLAANAAAPELARQATGKLRVQRLREEPVDLRFVALDGRTVDLQQMRGRVVLVKFWATWCGPCRAELPALKAAYERYHPRGLEIVGISLDGRDERPTLENFIREHGLPWPQYLDEEHDRNQLAERFGITEVPSLLLFDSKGLLVSERMSDRLLEGLLSAAPPHRSGLQRQPEGPGLSTR